MSEPARKKFKLTKSTKTDWKDEEQYMLAKDTFGEIHASLPRVDLTSMEVGDLPIIIWEHAMCGLVAGFLMQPTSNDPDDEQNLRNNLIETLKERSLKQIYPLR